MFSFGVDSSQMAKKTLPSSSASADEETQKRNTDCIYFLASPLTCKKGSNCDYRHSEAARMNPRDCRFWLSGNCLNGHCLFRHPPLEGRPVSTLTSLVTTAPSQAAGTMSTLNKSKTPCYFFSQGYCAKNDKCPFMHVSMASTMEAALQQKPAIEPAGKAEAVNSQAGTSSQGTPSLSEGHQPTPLKAQPSAVPLQVVFEKPNNVERARGLEIFSNSAPFKQRPMVQNNVPKNSRQNQFVKKMGHPMKEQGEVQRLMHTQIQSNQNGDLLDSLYALNEIMEPVVYSSHSASQESTKQLDSSLRIYGQEALDNHREPQSDSSEQEVDGRGHHGSVKSPNGRTGAKRYSNGEDLRDQLVKFRKNNTGTHAGGRLSHIQQDQKGREMYRMPSSQAEPNGVTKVAGVSLSGSDKGLRPVHLKSPLHKRPEKDQPGTMFKASKSEQYISERLTVLEKRVHVSTSTSVPNNNGASAFTGPKSLAQIKSEKMARTASVGKVGQAGPKPLDREPSGISNSSAIVKGDVFKKKVVVDFEGPKPLSLLLKEKRKPEADDSSSEETTLGRRKMELPMVKSSEELEEGEVAEDEDESNKSEGLDGISSEAGPEEEHLMSSQQLDVDNKQAVEAMQRNTDVDAADDELEVSEDGLLEMEDDAYDGEDLDIMEEDDDGAEFAKKLGSFFSMPT